MSIYKTLTELRQEEIKKVEKIEKDKRNKIIKEQIRNEKIDFMLEQHKINEEPITLIKAQTAFFKMLKNYEIDREYQCSKCKENKKKMELENELVLKMNIDNYTIQLNDEIKKLDDIKINIEIYTIQLNDEIKKLDGYKCKTIDAPDK